MKQLDKKKKIYHGSIRVHMNIKQAISIHNHSANRVLEKSLANMAYIDEDVEELNEDINFKKDDSNSSSNTFYLSSETSKVIHISR